MLRMLSYWLIPAFLFLAPPLEAQEPLEKSESVELRYRGADGVWFPVEMADEIFTDLEKYELVLTELQVTRDLVRTKDAQLEKRFQRIEDLQLAVDLSKTIEIKMQETLAMSEDSRRRTEEDLKKALESKNAWYRHPVLWVGVGIVLTVVAEVVFIKVTK